MEKVSGAGRMNALSVEERTALTELFCQTVQNAGYRPMIYYNTEMAALMLNLTELRSVGMKEIPLCASNAFYIGSATVMMQGDYLSVQLNFYPEANVEVHGASVYVITQGASLTGDPAYSGAAALSTAGGMGGCDRRVYGASVPAHAGQLRPIRSARAFL